MAAPKTHKVTEDDKRLIKQYAEQRVPISRQMVLLNLQRRQIERARKSLGLARPEQTRITPEQSERVRSLLEDDGCSIIEAHRTTGISQRWIREHYPGHGWTATQGAELMQAKRQARKAGIRL